MQLDLVGEITHGVQTFCFPLLCLLYNKMMCRLVIAFVSLSI